MSADGEIDLVAPLHDTRGLPSGGDPQPLEPLECPEQSAQSGQLEQSVSFFERCGSLLEQRGRLEPEHQTARVIGQVVEQVTEQVTEQVMEQTTDRSTSSASLSVRRVSTEDGEVTYDGLLEILLGFRPRMAEMLQRETDLAVVDFETLVTAVLQNCPVSLSVKDLEEIVVGEALSRGLTRPDFMALATCYHVTYFHALALKPFARAMREADAVLGQGKPHLMPGLLEFIDRNAGALEALLDHGADYRLSTSAHHTAEKAYLLGKRNSHRRVVRPLETYQQMLLRVSCYLYFSWHPSVYYDQNGHCRYTEEFLERL